MADMIKALEANPNEKIPQLAPGDTVSVHVKIKEGDKERLREMGAWLESLPLGSRAAISSTAAPVFCVSITVKVLRKYWTSFVKYDSSLHSRSSFQNRRKQCLIVEAGNCIKTHNCTDMKPSGGLGRVILLPLTQTVSSHRFLWNSPTK